MLSLLIGLAEISSPLTSTAWSLCAGRLNSDTPISRNEFLPAGGVFGTSAAGGAFALLGTGFVAFDNVHVPAGASFKQPVTLTIGIFCGDAACRIANPAATASIFMARIIAPVSMRSTQSTQKPQQETCSLRVPRVLRLMFLFWFAASMAAGAHDLEKTQVRLTFSRDGSFVLDVSNDPSWLKLRLESIPGSFADRIVLWVNGQEVRPTAIEFRPATADGQLATYRMRGKMPADANTLRWFYGLVIDPYPLTIVRADGLISVEEVQGNAWSRAIDLSGQFRAPRVNSRIVGAGIVALLLFPVGFRLVFTAKTGGQ